MAHSRSVKIEVLNNYKFKKKPLALKLLYIYLPMLADREGRLEDIPEEIHDGCLAHHQELDIESLIQDLEEMEFLFRYEIEDKKIIQIIDWDKKQSPHATEKDSDLPDVNGMIKKYARTIETP